MPEQPNEGEQQQAGADPAMDDLLGDWKEFLHPRDENGRWTDKFGGAAGLSSSILEDIRKKRDPYGKLDASSTGNSAGSKTGKQQGQSHITRPTDPIRLADGSVVRGNEKYVPYDGKYFYNEKTKKWVKIHEAKPVDKAYLKLKDDDKKRAVSVFSWSANNGVGGSFTGAALANLTANNPNTTSENVIGAYKTGSALSNLIGAPQATGLKTKTGASATKPYQPEVVSTEPKIKTGTGTSSVKNSSSQIKKPDVQWHPPKPSIASTGKGFIPKQSSTNYKIPKNLIDKNHTDVTNEKGHKVPKNVTRNDNDFRSMVNHKGKLKAYINEKGDLVSANPQGKGTIQSHVRGGNSKDSPYISTTDGTVALEAKNYGGVRIVIDTNRLQRDINSGKVKGVEIFTPKEVRQELKSIVDDLQKKYNQNPTKEIKKRLDAAKKDQYHAERDGECLIKGYIPSAYIIHQTK